MKPDFAFFGTGPIAVFVLEELARLGFEPDLIVTAPDKPQGRGLGIAPSPVGTWAAEHHIEALKPSRIDEETISVLKARELPLFIVADYGSLIKRSVLDIPQLGTLNVHPSLLPRLRGPSPIRSAILKNEKKVGVTIMLLDEEMDHGPVLAQKKIAIDPWPPRAAVLEETLARAGGVLLAEILPAYAAGEIEARPQNHDVATYTEKFEKADGEIDLTEDAYKNLLKIRAYEGWPTAYAFFVRDSHAIRVQILDAHVENGTLVIDLVKPEGKREMTYADFVRSGAKPI